MNATDRVTRCLDRVAPYRWSIIVSWLCIVGFLSAIWPGSGDWNYFRNGSGALLGWPTVGTSGGIHVYATMPSLQIGPPALVATIPFRLLPQPWDLITARVALAATLLLLLRLVDRLAEATGLAEDVRRRGILLGGVALVPAWVDLAVEFVHLDDVLVLVLAALAMLQIARRRPLLAAVLIGVAVAAKPWAIVLAPLLLRWGWRAAVRPVAVAAAVAAAWWAPFLLDPETLPALWGFRLRVSEGSGLFALGLEPATFIPSWVRPVQLLGGTALGVLAAARGRWAGVVLVGLATRVALDPNPLLYYGVGPVLGALLWDMTRTRSGIPWTAAGTMAALSLLPSVADPQIAGVVRLAACAVLAAVVLVRPARPAAHPAQEPAEALRD